MIDIMVDIDEVIAPTVDSIHQLAFERGIHDGVEPMKIWHGWKQYGIPEDVYWDLWSDFALDGGYTKMVPIPGSVEALRRLAFERTDIAIHLVTARGFLTHGDQIKGWTQEWVVEHAVPHNTLTFTGDKVASQAELGVRFDYAIDDSPKNFAALTADGVKTYLMDHPHNHDVITKMRVYSMDQFVYTILEENP
jgi:hypothetical protein